MLFVKELKKTIVSITYIILLIAVFAFSISQGVFNFGDTMITLPREGEEYGEQTKEVPDVIMPAAFDHLLREYLANNYATYPLGFYKNVKLTSESQSEIALILADLTGTDNRIFVDFLSEEASAEDFDKWNAISLQDSITYVDFLAYMDRADNMIGGGSLYSKTNLIENFGRVPVTYEEAVEQYELSKNADHFTGTYARLFCDYTGIILSLLPVFIGVAISLKDKRARMNDFIYVRRKSSLWIIFMRYLAILSAIILPVIMLAYISNSSIWALYEGMTLDYMAPLKYVIGWLLPSVMISASVGMFFTEFTGTPIAIAIQGVWWFIDLSAGVSGIYGDYGLFQLSPRHNILGNTQKYIDNFKILFANRLIIAGMALLLIIATVIVYEQKRRGKFGGYGKIKKHITGLADCKSKSAA